MFGTSDKITKFIIIILIKHQAKPTTEIKYNKRQITEGNPTIECGKTMCRYDGDGKGEVSLTPE